MKNSGGNKKQKAWSYKKIGLVFIAVLSITIFVFGGFSKSALIDLKKWFAENEEISGKNIQDNHDGTYKLSLNVTGDASATPNITTKANVLVVFDVSGSMQDKTYKYTAVSLNDTGSERYGLVNGKYVPLNRNWSIFGYYYTYNGSIYNGTRYSRTSEGERGLRAEKVVYDFATALSAYNDITAGTIDMAMITFSSNNHGSNYGNSPSGNENNATWLVHGNSNQNAWTTDISNITSHLSSNGTSRPRVGALQYGGGTNWEAAMQRAKSVVNALPNDRKNEPTFVIFVTDGAPTFRVTKKTTTWHDGNDSGSSDYGRGRSSDDDITNYYMASDEAKAIQDIGTNVNFYGIYAYGDEGDLLDDLVNYAYTGTDRTNYGKTNQQTREQWSATNSVDNYYNAADTTTLQNSISAIFGQIVESLGIGDVTIHDGTTSNVTTSSGGISHLLNVDSNSFTYGMSFPVTAVSGEEDTYTMVRKNEMGQDYTITLSKNEDGTYQASWGTTSVAIKGSYNLGKFDYIWEEANAFYNVAPPAASYNSNTGAVEWNLDRETVGTLLDKVTYTVYFDVYPSQETYDMVADIKNAENPATEYDALDPNIKEYSKRDSKTGAFTLKTNTNATLTYTDNRNGNTTSVTKKYRNPDGVPTESSKMIVKKVWLNELDDKTAPAGLSIDLEVQQENDEHELEPNGLVVTVNSNNDWEDSVEIATGLLRTKVNNSGKTIVEVLDPGYDYTLTEPEINFQGFNQYQWELEMETVHPMIVNGHLRTLVEVPVKDIPTGMTGNNSDVYTNGDHTFYRFNGHVYYDKYITEEVAAENEATETHTTLIPEAHLNAYNIRKSNFNFTKKVTGDVTGDEVFGFTFKINDTNIDENNIPEDATEEEKMNNYSVWFSVCDPEKLAAVGHKCSDPDTETFKISDYLEKGEGLTDATPEIKNGSPTGYYYKLDNTDIKVNIQAGWNVRVTNVGTESDYTITESTIPSSFNLENINGVVTVIVPELPANAVQVDDGIYDVNGTEYVRVEDEIDGEIVVHYQYDYFPTTDISKKTISGKILAPNNTYAVEFTNV